MNLADSKTIKLAIENIVGKNILSFDPVSTAGQVNDVFVAKTNDSKLIVRVNTADEFVRFEKERWCIESAATISIKVPEVLAIGKSGNYAYMAESYIEGSRADTFNSQAAVWLQIGQYARSLHAIMVHGFGENLDDIKRGNQSSWCKYLNENLTALESDDSLNELITANKRELICKWLHNLENKHFTFGLSHGDLSLVNAIVDESGEVNLLDWGAAEAHIVPHYDFGVILDDSLSDDSEEFRQVLKGYQMSVDSFKAIKPEIVNIMLLIALDKLRWAIDKQPKLIDQMVNQLMHHYKQRKLIG